MSELDRIKSLAGLATNNVAEESVEREMKEEQVVAEGGCECCGCSDSCGCPADCPTCDCNRVEEGEYGKKKKTYEASGEFAEPFYQLQDEFCGGECTSPAHKALIDELVNYMSGDDIKGFVADFRRHHDMNDVEENVEEAELSEEEQKILEAIPYMFKLNKEGKSVEEIAKELNMTVDAVKDAMSKAKNESVSEGKIDSKKMQAIMKRKEELIDKGMEPEEAQDQAAEENGVDPEDLAISLEEGWDDEPMSACCDAPLLNYDDGLGICSDCKEWSGPHDDELEESSKMDTTQLAIIMKNAGLSEETIAQKLEEWANTPEGVGEIDPTEHGDAYDMAQAVNLSLKKYLDAEDMKVQVSEDKTSEDLTSLYEAYKANKK